MKILRLCGYILGVGLWLCYSSLTPVAWAQTDEPFLVKEETDLVTLDAVVLDAQGNYALDLQVQDFELLEDDQPRQIDFFQTNGKLEQRPVALTFALDLSGSLSAAEIALQRQAIKDFIGALSPQSLCALMGFNNKIKVFQDFTSDRKKLAQKLNDIKDYGGSTRIYDALDQAITMFKKLPLQHKGQRLRRVIIVITDGFDSASLIDRKTVIAAAKQNNVTIYSVTLPSYPHATVNTGNIKPENRLPTLLDAARITDQTGGRDFSINNKDLAATFRDIASELAASYTLAYHPHRVVGGEKRRLQVRVKRPQMIVRCSRNSF
jgi:Ca-activated chloride channel homolog